MYRIIMMDTNNSDSYHKDWGIKNQAVVHDLPVKFLQVIEWVKPNYNKSILKPNNINMYFKKKMSFRGQKKKSVLESQ